ncbi:MAG: TIGR00730 family Rossman fold protein [Candidatus Gastranaerophilaceae bacterium]
MNICIFGAASESIPKAFKEEAEKICERLGNTGHNLIFGAGSTGIMGACARGFAKTPAKIYGYMPEHIVDLDIEPTFEACDSLCITTTLNKRKELMEEDAQAYIIMPGGIGTMDEFFEVLTLKGLGLENKPIIIYNIQGYYNNIISFLENCVANVPVNSLYSVVDNYEDLVKELC